MTIKKDDVFIYPTDTVWGIGCSLYSETGFNRISEIKKTEKNKPLSIMFNEFYDIYEKFNFPKEITLSWLETFFTLETTLGIPLKISKFNIPSWATGDSQYVSIRCLQAEVIKNIYQDLKAPFFTTSLNLTGFPPIISSSEALLFQKNYAEDALYFSSQDENDLSGSSSTIVFLEENLDFEIKREGKRVEEVKNHLKKLNPKQKS